MGSKMAISRRKPEEVVVLQAGEQQEIRSFGVQGDDLDPREGRQGLAGAKRRAAAGCLRPIWCH